MLGLGRRRNQKTVLLILPSDQPTVIVHTQGSMNGDGQIRGFWESPREVEIHRLEVLERQGAEQAAKDAIRPRVQP